MFWPDSSHSKIFNLLQLLGKWWLSSQKGEQSGSSHDSRPIKKFLYMILDAPFSKIIFDAQILSSYLRIFIPYQIWQVILQPSSLQNNNPVSIINVFLTPFNNFSYELLFSDIHKSWMLIPKEVCTSKFLILKFCRNCQKRLNVTAFKKRKIMFPLNTLSNTFSKKTY